MTDPQSNKLDMYTVVHDFYTQNQPDIDTVTALTNGFISLDTIVGSINKAIGGQSATSKGVTTDKTVLREVLDNLTLSIMAPAKAWALANGNNTLAQEFSYPLSDIQRIKDDTMPGFCTYRINLVNDNIATMADFGILPAQVTAWETALLDYTTALGTPRGAINKRHMYTASLKDLFADATTLFNSQLDPLMVQFKNTNPELYNGYKQARIIIDRRGQKPKPKPDPLAATLFGIVTDLAGGFVIADASILISPATEPILSAANGSYEKKNLLAGEHNVEVTLINYDFFATSITLEAGATFELNIQLIASAPQP